MAVVVFSSVLRSHNGDSVTTGWAFGNGTDEAHEHGIDIDAATSKFSAVDTAESVVALVDHPSSPNGYANGNSSPIAARTGV